MDIFEGKTARPMLIGRQEGPFDDPDYIFELKLDGERCLAYLDEGQTVLINKRGRMVNSVLPEMSGLHEQVGDRCILDGELVITTADGKPDFEWIKRRALTKNKYAIQRLSREYPATFVAFDCLYYRGQATNRHPLTERKEILHNLVRESERLALARVIEEHGKLLYAAVKEQGLEGIIGKRKNSLYHFGKRSTDWVKIKNWMDDDFVICGYIPKDNPVASLVLGQYRADELVYKGRVTIGLQREDFKLIEAQEKRRSHPFALEPPEATRAAIWLEPSLVCRVEFLKPTVTGALRQPLYKDLRLDKTPQEAIETFEGSLEMQIG